MAQVSTVDLLSTDTLTASRATINSNVNAVKNGLNSHTANVSNPHSTIFSQVTGCVTIWDNVTNKYTIPTTCRINGIAAPSNCSITWVSGNGNIKWGLYSSDLSQFTPTFQFWTNTTATSGGGCAVNTGAAQFPNGVIHLGSTSAAGGLAPIIPVDENGPTVALASCTGASCTPSYTSDGITKNFAIKLKFEGVDTAGVSLPYTVVAGDEGKVKQCTSTGTMTFPVPGAGGAFLAGTGTWVSNNGGGTCTIAASGGTTIGPSGLLAVQAGNAVYVVSTGSAYLVLGTIPGGGGGGGGVSSVNSWNTTYMTVANTTTTPVITLNIGTSANNIVALDGSAKLPAVDGSQLTNLPSSGSPLTTKGDLFTFSTVAARLPIGSNNNVLVADSAQTVGMKWAQIDLGSSMVGGTLQSGNITNILDGKIVVWINRTFSALPTCSSGTNEGRIEYITDSPTGTVGTSVAAGGGGHHGFVGCNGGSNWIFIAGN